MLTTFVLVTFVLVALVLITFVVPGSNLYESVGSRPEMSPRPNGHLPANGVLKSTNQPSHVSFTGNGNSNNAGKDFIV